MDTDRWTAVQSLFVSALDVAPDARDAWLREACDGDRALYREVVSLLDVEVHSLFEGFAADAVDLPALLSLEGERVGPYRIAEEIGRGGMGAVYRAERADGAYEQTVALKLVKRGMDSDAILRRFHQERQILARLAHPNVARLLDGGVSDDGRPYFAMEFVRGEPITAYCDARALSIDRRLDLFVQVCAAVAFAHRNLIVHRDLKPSNIFVTEDEHGAPRVKLLDFGIARLLDSNEAGLTWTGLRPMTLEYAAPEQISGDGVTTSTDIYALGALLYELLSGRRPHTLDRSNPRRLERAILEEEPPRPSVAVRQSVHTESNGTVTLESTARLRQTTPARLPRRLAGDLDTVALRALAKEPEARYPSADALADDVRRYRAGLPINARRPTVGYRIRKFASRHRTGVATAVAVTVLLGTVVGIYTVQLAAERDRARLEAAKTAEVAGFLTDLFEQSDPLRALGDTLTVFALLEQGTERIERDLVRQPVLKAELLLVLGQIYLNLGDPAQARPLLQQAVMLRRMHPDPVPLAASLRALGTAHRRLDASEEAEATLSEALRIQESEFGRNHAEPAVTLRELGALAHQSGRYEESERLLREALATQRAVLPDSSPELSATLADLAALWQRIGRLEAAEEAAREALTIDRAAHGPTHPSVATGLSNLGILARQKGDPDAAERAYRESLVIVRSVYGDDHLETATVMRNLASVLRDAGAYDEAADLYERALAIRRARLGPDHPRVANLLNSYGRLYVERGDLDAAAELYRNVIAIYRSSDAVESGLLAPALHNLAGVAESLGRMEEAESLYRESLTILRAGLPPDSPTLAFPLTSLGTFLTEHEQFDEATPLLTEAVTLRLRGLPPEHQYTAQSERRLSDALVGRGAYDEAEALLAGSIARLRDAGADSVLIDQAEERLQQVLARREG